MDGRTLTKQKARSLLIFFVAVLALGLAGFLFLRSPVEQSPGSGNSVGAPSAVTTAKSPPAVENAHKPAPSPAALPGSKLDTPRSQFERSKDLSQFVGDLRPLLDQRDPSALEAYATALSECAPLSVNPTFAEASRNSPTRPIPNYMLDDYIERCRALAASHKIGSAETKQLYKQAAEGGDMTALAQQFTSVAPSLPPDQASKMMRDIVESGDPYAISELSTALGADGTSSLSPFAGSEVYSDAWQLVACDLGMDCGPRSYIVRQMCLFAGICGASVGGFREVLSQAVLSPQDYQSAVQAEALILQAIKTGNYESLVK